MLSSMLQMALRWLTVLINIQGTSQGDSNTLDGYRWFGFVLYYGRYIQPI